MNENIDAESNEFPRMLDLLYIGKASNINERIGKDNHEHLEDFQEALKRGQILMYSRAFLDDAEERTIAEAALIYYCRPPINDDGKDAFHHEDTNLILSGQHALIDSNFIVYENGLVERIDL